MTSMIGSKEINLTTGGNVTNDFLDNLAAEQYRKMHNKKEQDLFEVVPKWKEWKESLQGKKRDWYY